MQTSPDLQTWTTLTNPTIIQTGNDPNTGDPIMDCEHAIALISSLSYLVLIRNESLDFSARPSLVDGPAAGVPVSPPAN